MACHPVCCISSEFSFSASKVFRHFCLIALACKNYFHLSAIAKCISDQFILLYFIIYASKIKLKLPSLAAILKTNSPPTLKSLLAAGVCQSADGTVHSIMSSGVVQAFQTLATGAFTVVSTVIAFSVDCCHFLCFK